MKNVMARIIGQSVKPAKAKPKAEQNVAGLDAAQSARFHYLAGKKEHTPAEASEYRSLCELNTAAIVREWGSRSTAQVKRRAPVLDMSQFTSAGIAARSLAKMVTRQAPEPEPEAGSALEYSRHHYVGHIGR